MLVCPIALFARELRGVDLPPRDNGDNGDNGFGRINIFRFTTE